MEAEAGATVAGEVVRKLYPERKTAVPPKPSSSEYRYLVEQSQNFVIELQSSAFYVGDHQSDEIQRYSDRTKPTLGNELAALPAWVPEGEKHKYMPRDILLWLDVSCALALREICVAVTHARVPACPRARACSRLLAPSYSFAHFLRSSCMNAAEKGGQSVFVESRLDIRRGDKRRPDAAGVAHERARRFFRRVLL